MRDLKNLYRNKETTTEKVPLTYVSTKVLELKRFPTGKVLHSSELFPKFLGLFILEIEYPVYNMNLT